MAKGIYLDIGTNNTALKRGLSRATSMVKGFARLSIAPLAAPAAALAAIAVPAVVATKAVKGLRDALDLGGRMSDLSARTGESVRNLMLLEQAFKDNGANAENVGITLDRLTRRVSIAKDGNNEYAKALDMVGLSAEELSAMSKADRFWEFGRALNAMGDESLKARAAMALLDTSAGDLFALFSNADALKNAEGVLGDQADILERNANFWDSIADKLGNVGTRIRGLFLGLAEYAAPQINALLDSFAQIDFVEIGSKLGVGVQALANLFKDGKTLKLVELGFAAAMEAAVNSVAPKFMEIADNFRDRLIGAASIAKQGVVRNAPQLAAGAIEAPLLPLTLPLRHLIKTLRGGREPASAIVEPIINKAAQAMASAATASTPAMDKLQSFLKELAGDAPKAPDLVRPRLPQMPGEEEMGIGAPPAVAGALGAIVDSFAKIGGGGFGVGRTVRVQEQQLSAAKLANTTLNEIAMNTRNLGAGAQYA